MNRRRLKEYPHGRQVIKDEDVELVLQRFQEAYEGSSIAHKIVLDNSDVAPEDTLAEFVWQVQPHLVEGDRARMADRRVHGSRDV